MGFEMLSVTYLTVNCENKFFSRCITGILIKVYMIKKKSSNEIGKCQILCIWPRCTQSLPSIYWGHRKSGEHLTTAETKYLWLKLAKKSTHHHTFVNNVYLALSATVHNWKEEPAATQLNSSLTRCSNNS